ncbi:universal stress protein [Streptomyces hiroshimensis]|uniref:Universal stress protein n=1 Tax=Streptomyces hiroshimensis TaxID=66424 RepID=A0ABQ2Y992_9ACTN|nr:universal stress protein [Streptomyces hiroshimensis]GGX74160.1 universal stress protein [Streptomyces hiroshimensis]
MELPLVVGVDGSDGSLDALDWAVDEAVRLGLPLRVVHSSLWERYEGPASSFGTERPADAIMAEHVIGSAEQRARQRAPELEVHATVVPEDAVEALVKESREAAALVTGSSGRGVIKGLLLGSVSLAVAGRADCPVTVVRGEQRNVRGMSGQVVVGVGEADEAASAVRYALREAKARGCELQAVRTWRCPQPSTDVLAVLDDTARAYEEAATAVLDEVLSDAQSEYPDVTVRRTVLEGPPHRMLLGPAAEADLLVLGTTRRQGHLGLQLGRVSHTALHHSSCPVAVVPHKA